MIETILLAILLAKIKGYKIKPLFMSWEIYPTFVFAVLYILLNIQVFVGNYSFIKYARTLESIYMCTFLILIIRYKQYISALIGSISVIVGTFLNNKAISANNGKMPVFPTLSYITGYISPNVFTKVRDIHILGNESSKLKFLTDVIDIGYSILSIGDIFIRIFVFIIIFNTIRSINKIET